MLIFKKNFKRKSDPNIHQNAPFNKIFSGSMPSNPPRKAHGFAMHSMSLRDMQISKSEKKIIAPPPPCQILATPLHAYIVIPVYSHIINYSLIIHYSHYKVTYYDNGKSNCHFFLSPLETL